MMPPDGIMYGLDTSHYQGAYDFRTAKHNGASFAGIQLTVGAHYVDAMGLASIKRADAAGLFVMPYHFLNGEPGKDQADHFLDLLAAAPKGVIDDVVIDIEPKQGCTRQVVEDAYERFCEQYPEKPVTYTGAGAFVRVMGGRKVNLAKQFGLTKLWHADYRGGRLADEDDQRFDLYYTTTDQGPIFGYGGFTHAQVVQFGGMFSTDGDAFLGDSADLVTFFGYGVPGPAVELAEGATKLVRLYDVLRRKQVRSSPGVPENDHHANVIAHLQPGDTFQSFQRLRKANGHLWLGSQDGEQWILRNARVRKVSEG